MEYHVGKEYSDLKDRRLEYFKGWIILNDGKKIAIKNSWFIGEYMEFHEFEIKQEGNTLILEFWCNYDSGVTKIFMIDILNNDTFFYAVADCFHTYYQKEGCLLVDSTYTTIFGVFYQSKKSFKFYSKEDFSGNVIKDIRPKISQKNKSCLVDKPSEIYTDIFEIAPDIDVMINLKNITLNYDELQIKINDDSNICLSSEGDKFGSKAPEFSKFRSTKF